MGKRAPSKHSRAARRATSPGIDIDKSLKNIKPPTSSVDFRPSILGIHQSAGVTKKTKGGRKSVLSSKARRRLEKGLDRAAAVMERTEVKVQRSKSQARLIQSRRAAWEEINSKLLVDEEQPKKKKRSAEDGEDNGDEAVRKFYEDTDEEMDEAAVVSDKATAADGDELAMEDDVAGGAAAVPASTVVAPEAVPLPTTSDDDDIL